VIRVEVRLHAGLLRFAPDQSSCGIYQREFADGALLKDLLASFGFPVDRRIIIGVDGQSASADDPLRDGSRIDLVPPIAGG
jgi:sulfur carrier protein ThiS